jgi:4-hydroxythreonine-4-phosphate dehydrogenase
MTCPRIAVTPGEPAGIGPDICIELAFRSVAAEVVFITDPELMRQRAGLLDKQVNIVICDLGNPPQPAEPGVMKICPITLRKSVECGAVDSKNAAYILDTLRFAVTGCLDGKLDAIVTGPVDKGVINEAGIAFTGHTEYLAALGGGTPVMMLATPQMKVALATTHIPLAKVSAAISQEHLESIIQVLARDLQSHLGIARPHIMVCGLNPHAGENGHLGREEIDIILPAMENLRSAGCTLSGPYPADTVFIPEVRRQGDVILAMYHDQGLPALKSSGFGQAVNITLGLPFIRTSVDHGTAVSLAGTGKARADSLLAAVDMAVELAQHMAHASSD